MSAIDLDLFNATPLEREPYDYLIVPGFVRGTALASIDADYPAISAPGSFPLSSVQGGAAFDAFINEMGTDAVRDAFARKFDVDLSGRPMTATVRGRCQTRDGRIHTDTPSKILTLLIYMNTEWDKTGGRLRVLRSGEDLSDYAAEVPPEAGTLLAFKRSEHSWHGHESFSGERRVIQLNWVTDEAVVRRETRRHRFSSFLKTVLSFGRNPAEGKH